MTLRGPAGARSGGPTVQPKLKSLEEDWEMTLLTVLRVVLIALVALAGPAAFAQTSDGSPPSIETVCDPLQIRNGGTPGLYGLCVAYCEAQDCGTSLECKEENPGDAWGAHSCGCSDVLTNYNDKKEPGDPDMPCIEPEECPCFDAEFLATEISTIGACVDGSTPTRDQTLVNGSDAEGCLGIGQTFTNYDAEGNPRAVVCQALDKDRDTSTGVCTTTLNTLQSGLTAGEFEACQALVRARCAP